MINEFIELIVDRVNSINNLTAYTNHNSYIDVYVGDQYKYIFCIKIYGDSLKCYVHNSSSYNSNCNIVYPICGFVDVDEFVGLILCRAFYN